MISEEEFRKKEKTLFLDPFADDFFELFTQKRMQLIKAIMDFKPGSIRELADKVERDIKNVFNDLKILDNHNIIDFVEERARKRPVLKKETIIFSFVRREEYNE